MEANGLCFAAGTMVMTEEGPRAIEQIEEGDRVLSVDPENGAEGLRVVTGLTRRQDVATIVVTVRDESARGQRGESR